MKDCTIKEGYVIDVIGKRIFQGVVEIRDGKISAIREQSTTSTDYILPGLVDAHIHIESSMLIPSEFAKLAVVHGTVASVSDPHEIANVLGISGVDYMISNGESVPFKFYFGAPSCVPATAFESSGASISADQITALLKNDKIKYLSEMMNFPGVLSGEKEVHQKLNAAKIMDKPVDGHAPGLKGEQVKNYIQSGITTDHECFTIDEALEKLKYGMKIQIREGSAAKNFDALIPLLKTHPDQVMFCSDDRHPDDLLLGHMNDLLKRAIQMGYDVIDTIRASTYIPVKHYKLDVGLLQVGDPADMLIVDSLKNFHMKETYINGELVASHGKCHFHTEAGNTPNIFVADPVEMSMLRVKAMKNNIKVIKALDGQLITKKEIHPALIENEEVISDTDRDILKIVVLNRYKKSKPALGFIHGFGLKTGAIASTVAHDSHNIIAIGTTDEALAKAINSLIETKGGIVLIDGPEKQHLPLPVAGIMSNLSGEKVAGQYESINKAAKKLGTKLSSPFMTLSFMALLVIPDLKLSDQGLFDGTTFSFTQLHED